MKITFLSGFKPLVKTFVPGDVRAYPMVKRVTSYEYEVEPDLTGLTKKLKLCREFAQQGAALLKGGLKTHLTNESRAGQTDNRAPSHSFILDFDNVRLHDAPKAPYSSDDIQDIAFQLVQLLPEPFIGAAYIAHPSASLGMKKDRVSMHIEFFCDLAMDVKLQKNLLRYLNLTNDLLYENMGLTATGRGLTWPIDICVADNSRMIFIGTPIFDGVDNPIPDDSDRFQLVVPNPKAAIVSTEALIDWFDEEDMNKRIKKRLNQLQTANGISKTKDKTQRVNISGFKTDVVTNPPEMEMVVHQEYDGYVTYDLNGGDSHGYFVHKNNPSVIYNWKDEPPMLFQRVNPEMYQAHIDQYGISGEGPTLPLAFRDTLTDSHFACLYDPETKRLIDANKLAKQNLPDFFTDHGGVCPDPIPQVAYKFDPTSSVTVDLAARFVNKWREPERMTNPKKLKEPVEYEDIADWVHGHCPNTYKVLKSVTGGGGEELPYFINWLAFIVQNRTKTGTAWLFQGVQGTGKGVLFGKLIKPIFERYAMEKRIENLEDNFNLWINECLICAIDEFSVNNSQSSTKLINKVKNYITEEEQATRQMTTDQFQSMNFMNIVAFTNVYDPLPLDPTDRRWNICPRQNVPLMEQFDDMREVVSRELPKELDLWTSFIHSVNVDEGKAHTPMYNAAKISMRETSMTTLQAFGRALTDGDIEFFLDVFHFKIGLTENNTDIMAAHNTVKGWVRDAMANPGEPILLAIQEIEPVYRLLVGRIENTSKLEKALAKSAGLKLEQWRVNNVRKKGYLALFGKVEPVDWQAIAENLFTDVDKSVIPFKKQEQK